MIDLWLRLVRSLVAWADFTKIMPHIRRRSPDFLQEIGVHAA